MKMVQGQNVGGSLAKNLTQIVYICCVVHEKEQ